MGDPYPSSWVPCLDHYEPDHGRGGFINAGGDAVGLGGGYRRSMAPQISRKARSRMVEVVEGVP